MRSRAAKAGLLAMAFLISNERDSVVVHGHAERGAVPGPVRIGLRRQFDVVEGLLDA